jgi:hypothetical protein
VKRSLIAILAIFYLVISSGFTINFHYCMGKLKTVKLQAIAGKLCGCKAGENNKCCQSEYKVVKLQSEHNVTEAWYTVSPPVAVLPSQQDPVTQSALETVKERSSILPIPPLIGKDILITNRTFRI